MSFWILKNIQKLISRTISQRYANSIIPWLITKGDLFFSFFFSFCLPLFFPYRYVFLIFFFICIYPCRSGLQQVLSTPGIRASPEQYL